MKVVVLKLAMPMFDAEGFEERLAALDALGFREQAEQMLGLTGIEDARVQLVAAVGCPCPDADHGPSVTAMQAVIVDARIEDRREFDEVEDPVVP